MYPIGFFCTHASRAFFTPLSRLGDEQMLRILGRGHSVHGHRIDYCERIQLIVPQSAKCFYFTMVKHSALTALPSSCATIQEPRSAARECAPLTQAGQYAVRKILNSNFRKKLDSVSGVYGKQEVKLPRYVCKFMVQEIA